MAKRKGSTQTETDPFNTDSDDAAWTRDAVTSGAGTSTNAAIVKLYARLDSASARPTYIDSYRSAAEAERAMADIEKRGFFTPTNNVWVPARRVYLYLIDP